MRTVWAIAAIAGCLFAGTIGAARAKSACVTSYVVAPGLGRVDMWPCAPLPDWFDGHETLTDCQWIPALGVSDCVTVSTDWWAP